jgi:hypothetical protein
MIDTIVKGLPEVQALQQWINDREAEIEAKYTTRPDEFNPVEESEDSNNTRNEIEQKLSQLRTELRQARVERQTLETAVPRMYDLLISLSSRIQEWQKVSKEESKRDQ